MELWIGALSWWTCHWPDLMSAGLFRRNLFMNSLSNPKSLANQHWYIDFLTLATSLIIPHRLPAFLESLMPLKNWCSIHARCSKTSLKNSMLFSSIFPSLKQNFIAYRTSKVSDYIFEIHQLWESGFSREYSNSCSSCSLEAEIIKIGQSSHKMYGNILLNFKALTPILNAHTKKVWNLIVCPWYIYVSSTDRLFHCIRTFLCGSTRMAFQAVIESLLSLG